MTYTNKTYVAFDADSDIHFYRLMQAWKKNDNTSFNFYDAHDINNLLLGSSEETIKAKLRERMNNTKVFVLLAGAKTKYLYKFVRWEIEQAIKRNLPIVVVNLSTKRSMDEDICPAILRDKLAMHVSFNAKIVQHAIDNWPSYSVARQKQVKSGPYYYKKHVYDRLGL